jgi:hypothetical protein
VIDRCDAELISSAYHPDAIDYHGAITASGAEIGAILADKLRTHYRATRHQISNSFIELHGDLAAAETNYVAEHISDDVDGEHVIRGVGRYVDQFERRDGVWGISKRTVVTYWAHNVCMPPEPQRPAFTSPPSSQSTDDISYTNFEDVRRLAMSS